MHRLPQEQQQALVPRAHAVEQVLVAGDTEDRMKDIRLENESQVIQDVLPPLTSPTHLVTP